MQSELLLLSEIINATERISSWPTVWTRARRSRTVIASMHCSGTSRCSVRPATGCQPRSRPTIRRSGERVPGLDAIGRRHGREPSQATLHRLLREGGAAVPPVHRVPSRLDALIEVVAGVQN